MANGTAVGAFQASSDVCMLESRPPKKRESREREISNEIYACSHIVQHGASKLRIKANPSL